MVYLFRMFGGVCSEEASQLYWRFFLLYFCDWFFLNESKFSVNFMNEFYYKMFIIFKIKS